MDKFAKIVGRQYKLFDYVGAPDAERIIVMMGYGAETAEETVEYLIGKGREGRRPQGRLFRPFSLEHFVAGPPHDREVHRRPGPHQGAGRPRRAAVRGRAHRHRRGDGRRASLKFKDYPAVVGGRYGLGSYEFTGAMAKAVFDKLKQDARRTTSPSASTTT